MIARLVMASMVLLVGEFCAGDNKKETQKDDKDQLQGEWVVVSAEVGGRQVEGLQDKKLVVKGDEWIAPTVGTRQFKFKIDAAKKPKQLDLVSDVGGKQQTWAGIYKIEGDTLTFCRSARPGGERPTKFKGGEAVGLMVFKRAEKK